MPKLFATKSFSYATRRLLPGDSFEANNRDARILVAIGKAKQDRVPGHIAPPPADLAKKARPADDKEALAKLRADYQEVVGKKPFPGWKADKLQRRIDEALAS